MSIEVGQQFSLWAVRLALLAWFAFAWSMINGRRNELNQQRCRVLWTLATILYVMHVVLAFAYFHDWSHAAAVEHTAERTAEVTGINWGDGIWFNYLFTLVCIVEMGLWWVRPQSITQRSAIGNVVVYGYCLFIIVNAAVIFVAGPVRWVSASALLVLTCLFVRNRADAELST